MASLHGVITMKTVEEMYANNLSMLARYKRAEQIQAERKRLSAAAEKAKSSTHDMSTHSSPPTSDSVSPSSSTLLGPPDKSIAKITDPSMNVDDYQYPKKTAKLTTHDDSYSPIATANSYHMLGSETSDSSTKQSDHKNSKSDRTPSQTKPPAIYTYDITNRYTFSKGLAATCTDRPVIKHTTDYIRFQTNIKTDFDKIQTYGLQQKLQFATESKKVDPPSQSGFS